MNYKNIGLLGILFCLTIQVQAQGPKRYNLKVGDQFRVTAEVKQDITQTMLGQDMETKQTITTVDLYEVVAVTSEGYKMRSTGLSRSLYTETAGGSVSMDSDMDGDDHLAFRALTNKSFYAVMNRYGRLLRFEGMEEFKDEVRNELRGTILEDQTEQLLTSFKDKTLATAFDGQFYIYQEPGQPWNRSAEMVVNNLPINVDYVFSRVNAGTIRATGTMNMSGEIEVMGQIMTADMGGDQSSEFKLDTGTGLPTSIKTIQDMDGSLELQDLTVPMTLKTVVNVRITM